MKLLKKIASIVLVISLVLPPVSVYAETGTEEQTGVEDIYFEGTDTTRAEKEEIRTYPSRETCEYGWYYLEDYTEFEYYQKLGWEEFTGVTPQLRYDETFELRNVYRERTRETDTTYTSSGWKVYDTDLYNQLLRDYAEVKVEDQHMYYTEDSTVTRVKVFDGYVYTDWLTSSSQAGYTLYDTKQVLQYTDTCTVDTCPSGWTKVGEVKTGSYEGIDSKYALTKPYTFESGDYYYVYYSQVPQPGQLVSGYHKVYEIYDKCEKDYYRTYYKFRKATYRYEYVTTTEKVYAEGYYFEAPVGYPTKDETQKRTMMLGSTTAPTVWNAWSSWELNSENKTSLNEPLHQIEVRDEIEITATRWSETAVPGYIASGESRLLQRREYHPELSETQPPQEEGKPEYQIEEAYSVCKMEFKYTDATGVEAWRSQEELTAFLRSPNYLLVFKNVDTKIIDYLTKFENGEQLYFIVDDLGYGEWVRYDQLPVNVDNYSVNGVHNDYYKDEDGTFKFKYDLDMIAFQVVEEPYVYDDFEGVTEAEFCSAIGNYRDDSAYREKVYLDFMKEGDRVYNDACQKGIEASQKTYDEYDELKAGLEEDKARLLRWLEDEQSDLELAKQGIPPVHRTCSFTDPFDDCETVITATINSIQEDLSLVNNKLDNEVQELKNAADRLKYKYTGWGTEERIKWQEKAIEVRSGSGNTCEIIYKTAKSIGNEIPQLTNWFDEHPTISKKLLDFAQIGIDFVGMIFDPADAVNGIIYITRGMFFEGALSFAAAALSYVGEIVKGFKYVADGVMDLFNLMPTRELAETLAKSLDDFIVLARAHVPTELLTKLDFFIDNVTYNIRKLYNSVDEMMATFDESFNYFYDDTTELYYYKSSDGSLKPLDGLVVDGAKKIDYFTNTTADIVKHYSDNVIDSVKVTGSNAGTASTVLRRELLASGIPDTPFASQAHHIVAAGDTSFYALEAQEILKRCGVDLNSAANGVLLPITSDLAGAGTASVHRGRNTEAYLKEVYYALVDADPQDAADAAKVLNDLREQLLEGTLKINNAQ